MAKKESYPKLATVANRENFLVLAQGHNNPEGEGDYLDYITWSWMKINLSI